MAQNPFKHGPQHIVHGFVLLQHNGLPLLRMMASCCWQVYWPEEGAAASASDRPQALIGWRIGPRCLVVAALAPLEGAAERLGALPCVGGSAAAAASGLEAAAAGPCLLGEYHMVSDGSSRMGDSSSMDAGVRLVMAPGPRVRALHVRKGASAEGEAAAAPTTIAVTLYRRSLHGGGAAAALGLRRKGTALDSALLLMAQAGRLQCLLDGGSTYAEAADAPPGAAVPAAAEAAAPPPAPSLLLRSSLTCVQLRTRGMAAWRVLRCRESSSSPSPSSTAAGGAAAAAAAVGLALDSLLGAALGLLLCRHGGPLGAALGDWHRALLHPEALARDVAWLASDPGGFKLNLPLTQRLGAVVVLVARLYAAALQQAVTTTTTVAAAVAIALPLPWGAAAAVAAGAVGGATTLLALAFDLLRVATGHVPLIHASIARVYRVELGTLAALARLFRGRKRNALRRRVDSCEYRTPQLLLGTLLFTVAVALFPTLLAFHALCTTLHLAVRAAQAGLWLLLVLLRDLPLHGLALRLCAPTRFLDLGRIARCRPSPCHQLAEGDSGGGDDVSSAPAPTLIHHHRLVGARSNKGGSSDGVTGAGGVIIADTEEEGEGGNGQEGAPEPLPATQALLRLEYGRVPWARLLDGYARTGRALRTAGPSPGRALGALLVGGEGDGEGGDVGEGGPPPRLVFLQYRSLSQILVEVAWASSSALA